MKPLSIDTEPPDFSTLAEYAAELLMAQSDTVAIITAKPQKLTSCTALA